MDGWSVRRCKTDGSMGLRLAEPLAVALHKHRRESRWEGLRASVK